MTTLDELRRANLQEQRRSAERAAAGQAPAGQPAPAGQGAPAATPEAARPQNNVVAPAAPAPVAAPPAEAPAPRAPRITQEVTREMLADPTPGARSSVQPGGMAPEMDLPPPVRSEASLDDPFLQVVRERLSRRVIYRTGVKATVDMPPELFWRLKRYCHDHNNLTVRQAFLDLMIAYLEHEGY
jgi:hypothetical protein